MGMSSAETAWVLRVDLPSCDARFGADHVDRVLQDPREYAEAPRVDRAGSLSAALIRGPRDPIARASDRTAGPIAVRARLSGETLEVACECSSARQYVCDHVVRVLVDVAAHPEL